MKKLISLALFALLFCTIGTANASKFNYSFVSLNYMQQTVDMSGISKDLKADGYELVAAFEVNRQFGVNFSFGKAKGDVTISGTKVTLDVDAKSLGAFFHAPVSSTTDVVLGAALLQGELKASASGYQDETESVDGQKVFIMVRSMLGNKMELNAGADQSFIDGESDSAFSVGIQGYLMNDLSLGLNFSFSDDSDITYLSLYKYF